MADEKKTSMMSLIRDRRDHSMTVGDFRSLYENDWDSPRRSRADPREIIEYALRVLSWNAERCEASPSPTRYGDRPEAHLAREAIEGVHRAFQSQSHLKTELRDSQYDASKMRNIVHGLAESPTMVYLTWSEEIDAWCTANFGDKWKSVRDGGFAYYMFHDIKSAALCKTMWG